VLEVVKQAVDGEVAAVGVLVRFAEHVVVADEQVFALARAFFRRAPEGRGLDHLAAPEQHVHEPEAPADDARVAE